MSDLRFAFRQLQKHPGFTAVVVLTLALGIGANTAIFSVVNPVLFRPLPFREPDRLVFLHQMNSVRKEPRIPIAYPDYLDWRTHNRVFEDVGVFQAAAWTVTGTGDPERTRGARISATLFSVLGVAPCLGRSFGEGEDLPGGEPIALLGYGYWQQRFGGDTNVIGQRLSLSDVRHTIVGVMPPGFCFPDEAEIWVPLVITVPERLRGAHDRNLGIARLKPGVTLEQARADLLRISRRIEAEHPDASTGVAAVVQALQAEAVREFVFASWVLLGAVVLVLAGACANVANLSLSRTLDRQREWAIRLSLGSSRWRLMRLLLTESFLLAVAGGGLGLLFARWSVRVAQAMLPADAPFWLNFSLDYRVLLFSAGVVVVSGLLFGVAPAWLASRIKPVENLRGGNLPAGDQPRQRRWRGILVAAEVAVALPLLGGTLVLVQSLWNLQRANPGFNPRDVLTMSVTASPGQSAEPTRRIAFFDDARQHLAGLPGVKCAAAIFNLPMRGDYWSQAFCVESQPHPAPAQRPLAAMRVVTPGYFRTMEIPLRAGRDFASTDQPASPPVVIVEESFVRRYFPNENPLGRRIQVSNRPDTWWEIVGVAGNANQYGFLSTQTQSGFYFPHTQQPVSSMTLVLRVERTRAEGLLVAARNEVRQLDRAALLDSPRFMEDVMARSYWQIPLLGKLLATFAVLGLVLAAVGISGVVSYAVSQRTREIGVRLALGSSKTAVIGLLLREGFRLALAGIGIGLLVHWGLVRVFQSELFGVTAADLRPYLVLVLVLGLVALAACYVPARRAAKVEPLVALRTE